ncbi:hypothetical protein I352_01543 [Cryptococcus deuterogattii MMRL2647]|nr:hypothetical protein I352_01543 [Cryptococcus deuterogattii MMRL2647]
MAEGVTAVGDRRPSVLSGGLSDRKESDQLTLRKISAGGKEELIQINPASIDPSMIPSLMDLSLSQYPMCLSSKLPLALGRRIIKKRQRPDSLKLASATLQRERSGSPVNYCDIRDRTYNRCLYVDYKVGATGAIPEDRGDWSE